MSGRWERAWDETVETPAFDGCGVRIEPESEPTEADLLGVKQMWIATEWPAGSVLPWSQWTHGLFPPSD